MTLFKIYHEDSLEKCNEELEVSSRPDGEWTNWLRIRPPNVLVECWREEWSSTNILLPEEMHPEMNIANLYWRLTGIGKEQLAVGGVI